MNQDPLKGVDFEKLYYDFEACMEFLKNMPETDMTGGQVILVHMLWRGEFGRKQVLPLKSFLATQSNRFHLNLWSDSDIGNHPLLTPLLGERITFKPYDMREEWKKAMGCQPPGLGIDENCYASCDLFRWLILNLYGGLHVDMDSVFLRDMSPVVGEEFLYKWSHTKDLISSATMYLRKGSELSQLGLRLIRDTPAGGYNWGQILSGRAHKIKPFRVIPCAFFNPYWVSSRGSCEPFENDPNNPNTTELYDGAFMWHWHNRWDREIQPGCKFELYERLIEEKLKG